MAHRYTILVVDDKPDNLNLIEVALQKDFTVWPANSGAKALKIIETRVPDLVLLDVQMPELSGFKVAKILKNDERLKHIPIVFLTALENEKDEEAGLKIGAIDYLHKPFTPSLLSARVHKYITDSIAREAIRMELERLQTDGVDIGDFDKLKKAYEKLKKAYTELNQKAQKLSAFIKTLTGENVSSSLIKLRLELSDSQKREALLSAKLSELLRH